MAHRKLCPINTQRGQFLNFWTTQTLTSTIFMMRYYQVIVFILLLPLGYIFAAELRFECPPEIQTTQAAKGKAPEGWSSLRETQSRQWLDSVGVFDGPPQELAALVPDNEENQDLKKTVWTFNKKKERPIWLSCSYLKTDMLFAKSLPMEITQCRLLTSKSKSESAIGLSCK